MKVYVPLATLGIIPAYAGSTRTKVSTKAWHVGSSPHTRGAHAGLNAADWAKGIIPAYAGSTLNDLRNYTAFLNS